MAGKRAGGRRRLFFFCQCVQPRYQSAPKLFSDSGSSETGVEPCCLSGTPHLFTAGPVMLPWCVCTHLQSVKLHATDCALPGLYFCYCSRIQEPPHVFMLGAERRFDPQYCILSTWLAAVASACHQCIKLCTSFVCRSCHSCWAVHCQSHQP